METNNDAKDAFLYLQIQAVRIWQPNSASNSAHFQMGAQWSSSGNRIFPFTSECQSWMDGWILPFSAANLFCLHFSPSRWSIMQSTSPTVFVNSSREGIARVRAGNYAYLMESIMLEYWLVVIYADCRRYVDCLIAAAKHTING